MVALAKSSLNVAALAKSSLIREFGFHFTGGLT